MSTVFNTGLLIKINPTVNDNPNASIDLLLIFSLCDLFVCFFLQVELKLTQISVCHRAGRAIKSSKSFIMVVYNGSVTVSKAIVQRRL